jgi:hypothetical protein
MDGQMVPGNRFCEECGRPLAEGVKFCEECGTPVRHETVGSQISDLQSDALPLAVVPFAYRSRGAFSIDRCNLVVYRDSVIIAFVPPGREKENDRAMNDVQAALLERQIEGKKFWQLASGAGVALFKLSWSPVNFFVTDSVEEKKMLETIALKDRPWERYLGLIADAVLAEDKRNVAIPKDSISYIRGESDPSTSIDQILVNSSSGLIQLFFDFGTFDLARAVLFSFLMPEDQKSGERVVGVVPSAEEPQVKGFGFQYYHTLIVTDQRIIFSMIEDDFADEMNAWVSAKQKEAKKAGKKLRTGELAGMPDAPWQRFMNSPISSFFENEVSFFIPLPAIRQARILSGDMLTLDLKGEPYSVRFPEGTSDHLRTVLGKVLQGKVA